MSANLVEVQDLMAKMIANENFDVVYTNGRTAYFDLGARILALPSWNDLDPIVADYLRAHEVGHAKWTPKEGWHSSIDCALVDRAKYKYPMLFKDCLNIIEDVRIERLMKDLMPGFRKLMPDAATIVFQKHFLEGKYATLDEYVPHLLKKTCADRINFVAKVNDFHVILTDDDRSILNRAMLAETFPDIVPVAEDLYRMVLKEQKLKDDTGAESSLDMSAILKELAKRLGDQEGDDMFAFSPDDEKYDEGESVDNEKLLSGDTSEEEEEEAGEVPAPDSNDSQEEEEAEEEEAKTSAGKGGSEDNEDEPEGLNEESLLSETQKAFEKFDKMEEMKEGQRMTTSFPVLLVSEGAVVRSSDDVFDDIDRPKPDPVYY